MPMDNALGTKMPEKLQAFFLSEGWKDHVRTLSDTIGFDLSIYSGDGNLIFSVDRPYQICRELQSQPELMSECNNFCRNTMMQALVKDEPIVYTCYAKIMSFAFPVSFMSEKAVVLGQGSFPTYEDLREFMKLMNSSRITSFSIKGPLRFTTAENANNACRLASGFINQELQNFQETISLKKKMNLLKEILSMWNIAAKEQPATIYKYMITNLVALLDIEHAVIFTLDRENNLYRSLYSMRKKDKAADVYVISEDDAVVHELKRRKSFVSSMGMSLPAKTGFLKEMQSFYFFPVVVGHAVEGIIGIFDSNLKKIDVGIVSAFCRQAAVFMENREIREELYRKFDRFAAISNMTKDMTPVYNFEALLQVILDKSAELLKAEQGSLMLIDHETEALLLKANKGLTAGIIEQLRVQRGEGIAGKVVAYGKPFLVKDVESDPRVRQKNRPRYKTKSFVSVPMTVENRVIGVLNLSDKTTGEVFDEEDLRLIQSFASHAAVVMERNALYKQTEELKKLAITDPLTGLLNRRYLNDRLEEELLRSKRFNRLISLIMVDLDGFKKYNDAFGHPMGDRALKDISETILNAVRSIDIASRYGGDEFVIILLETDKELAVSIAERLRINTATAKLPPDGISLTASIGIASYPADGETSEALFKNLDNALYSAKNKGGNRVEVFSQNSRAET